MPKRFIATELWSEDWFLDMPSDYKLFWYYMLSKCDHAGIFKPNLKSFSRLSGVNLTSNDIINYFNEGKIRISVISESAWYIVDFFVFQYGTTFNEKNRVHESVGKEYQKHKISLTSIRGLKELKVENTEGVKDKDKDKDIIITKISEKTKKNEITNFATQGYDLLAKRLQG